MSESLEKRWVDLFGRIKAFGNAEMRYEMLVERYAESGRAYHTLGHIHHCLLEFDRVRHLAQNPDAVELALWYHDVVYDTRRMDNEELSADLMRWQMGECGHLPQDFLLIVGQLIMATKHLAGQTELDAQLFVDIDLAILGQSEEGFDAYEKQIRKEYEWVDDDVFVFHRTRLLRKFLDRKAIYLTAYFFAKYESRARSNIARSLTRLRA